MNREGEHTLTVIESCRIPPWDHCVHMMATGQARDKCEGPIWKEFSATQSLNNILEIRDACIEFKGGKTRLGREKKKAGESLYTKNRTPYKKKSSCFLPSCPGDCTKHQ